MNPTLVLAQSGATLPVTERQTPNFVNLLSPDGTEQLGAPLATAGQGGVQWFPQSLQAPYVNWVKVGNTYRCTPDNGNTPIAVVVGIVGTAPTPKG